MHDADDPIPGSADPTAGAMTTARHAGFVIGSLGRGGAETHLAQILPRLRERGYRVRLFVFDPTGPVADEMKSLGIDIASPAGMGLIGWLPAWPRRLARALLLVPSLWAFALRHRRGLVDIFLPEAIIVCGLLLTPIGARFVVSQRGLFTYRARYPGFVTALERFVHRRARLVMANSGGVARELAADGVPAEKLLVIYNGLSADRLSPPGADRASARAALGLAPDGLVILTVANLHPYKGHLDLVEALGRIAADQRLRQDWVCVAIGSDVEVASRAAEPPGRRGHKAALEQRARDLGIADRVRFVGAREDVPRLLRAADIGVLASHEEGFSNALVEKMAAGLAVVATDVGGNAEALDGGACGLVVPARDPAALAGALGRLIGDSDERRRLGEAARARALAQYNVDACVDNYVKAFDRVLGLG